MASTARFTDKMSSVTPSILGTWFAHSGGGPRLVAAQVTGSVASRVLSGASSTLYRAILEKVPGRQKTAAPVSTRRCPWRRSLFRTANSRIGSSEVCLTPGFAAVAVLPAWDAEGPAKSCDEASYSQPPPSLRSRSPEAQTRPANLRRVRWDTRSLPLRGFGVRPVRPDLLELDSSDSLCGCVCCCRADTQTRSRWR